MPSDPTDHDVGAYEYPLPAELVAQAPLAQRDASRLLVLHLSTGALSHRTFSDLPDLLRPGDLLVTNPQPRLPPPSSRGAGRAAGPPRSCSCAGRADVWQADGRRAGASARTVVDIAPGSVSASRTPCPDPGEEASTPAQPQAVLLRRVRLLLDQRPDAVARGALDPETAVERHGHVPLPPYIRRPDEPSDRERCRPSTPARAAPWRRPRPACTSRRSCSSA
jgi:S-adenosylmethionine:tRNA ribosyltransferase-isomerase